jgi:hypothetical protein
MPASGHLSGTADQRFFVTGPEKRRTSGGATLIPNPEKIIHPLHLKNRGSLMKYGNFDNGSF